MQRKVKLTLVVFPLSLPDLIPHTTSMTRGPMFSEASTEARSPPRVSADNSHIDASLGKSPLSPWTKGLKESGHSLVEQTAANTY